MRSALLLPMLTDDILGLSGAGSVVITDNYDSIILSVSLNKQTNLGISLNRTIDRSVSINKTFDFIAPLNKNAESFSLALNRQIDFTLEK